ncbi:hypothetical protein Tco_0343349 [Tanacetum coccineum]
MKPKAKRFPLCTHCSFNDYRLDDCCMYPECEVCGSNDHATSGHIQILYVRGGVLAGSSQSSEFIVGLSCNTCRSTIHSTTDHCNFKHFKRETHQEAHLVPGQ